MATRYDIVHRSQVASTQDEAIEEHQRTGRPVLVVADRQVHGRGRQGRTWVEADRAMYASLCLRVDWPPERRTLIPLLAGVAMADTLSDRAVALKWPNDLLVDGAKIGGVLVEASDDRVTVGCGLNLWWPDPIEGAAAVYGSDPGPDAAMEVADAWATTLIDRIERGPAAWQPEDYLTRSVTIGRGVRWSDGAGVATGIADDGALIVDTGSGMTTIGSGDVHLLDHG